VNGLRRLVCEGVMFYVYCVVLSPAVLSNNVITVFRVACCTSNVSAVGLLTQGVDTASINQSFKKSMATSHSK
jgi:hypothetical protein